jgi:hypothetical protein
MMKFLNYFLITNFLILLSACQINGNSPEEKDFDKLIGLITKIEGHMYDLSQELKVIVAHHEMLLEKKDSILAIAGPSKYNFEGSFSSNKPGEDSTLSSIILLNSSKDLEKSKEFITLTNSLDSLFAKYLANNPEVVQIFSNSAVQASRIYPAFDAKNIVDPSIDITTFNFYYEADFAHNPRKGTVWLPDAYVDPAGKGWIFSLVHPVYDGQELVAVLGIDLPIKEAFDAFLDSEEGYFVLVNQKGDIIGGTNEALKLLGMPVLHNHVYRESIQENNFRDPDFNLFQSKNAEVRKMAKVILEDKKIHFNFEQDSQMKRVLGLSFSNVDWFLLEIQLLPK